MKDIINRQDAINAVEKESQKDGAYGYMDTKSIIDLLEDLPSAERKKGKWKCSDDLFEYGICPKCGWDSGESWGFVRENYNFCPNCGAEMKGEDDADGAGKSRDHCRA